MLQEILTSEAFWFWTMIIVQSALIVFFVEHASPVGAIFSLVTLLIGIAFFPGQWASIGLGGIQTDGFWSWLRSSIWPILAGMALYLILGLAWGLLRWWLFVRQQREDYDQQKSRWLLPTSLDQAAAALRTRAGYTSTKDEQSRLLAWAAACSAAALQGGGSLTHELKPAWKDYVQNGYRH